MKPKREPFKEFTVRLLGPKQDAYLAEIIPQAPHDPERPLQVVIREEPKKRKKSMNDAYWAGPMRDIERDAWNNGRQYIAAEWHEGFKEIFLPDPDAPDFDPSHVVNPETYRKWSINPVTGKRTVVGSTTHLTDKGMGIFWTQVEAFMSQAPFYVQFTTRDEPRGYSGRCA
jgi:hypothetical protein